MSDLPIRDANGAGDVETARALFREYEAAIGVDLCFQGFEAELAGLPGAYVPPRGRLLIAGAPEAPAGCVALRPIDADAGEMKRLYVRPEFRAAHLGRRLAERVIADARAIGYRRICLDTLPMMQSAQRLYESLGFRDIAPYRPNPVVGARYMGLEL